AAKLPAAGRLTPLSSAPRARPAVGIEASKSAPAATEAAMRLRLLIANLPTLKVRFCPCQRAVEKMQNPNEQFLSPHGDSHRFSPHVGCTPPKAGLATSKPAGRRLILRLLQRVHRQLEVNASFTARRSSSRRGPCHLVARPRGVIEALAGRG